MKVVLRLEESPGPTVPSQPQIGLGRDHVDQVRQGVEDDHRAVLGTVFVARDQAAADIA